ncbi:MAG TPA: DsbE family thiol:disulfide interchange protein [Acetobacteraceae bacterium]|nr:DsbE family thiol:disulfide interchange protein [Acetobacteraceae bacterium]
MPLTLATRRRLMLAAPLGLAAIGGFGFLRLLDRMQTGRYDPHAVPNFLVGHPVPPFTTTAAPPGAGFSTADLQNLPQPVLVNFFASWCVPCRAEHTLLMQLQSQGVAIWGIAYEDSEAAMAGLLAAQGNPYARLGADKTGAAAIAWGISGVPESFLVDRGGVIRWHIGGPLSAETIAGTLEPLLRKYA